MIMSMQPSMELGIRIKLYQQPRHQAAAMQRLETQDRTPLLGCNLPLNTMQLFSTCSSKLTHRKWKQVCGCHNRRHEFRCHCFLNPATSFDAKFIKNATLTLSRSSYNCLQARPLEMKLAASLGIVIFAIWGLVRWCDLPGRCYSIIVMQKSGGSWKTSGTYQLTTSCFQPLLLWTGTYLICRSLDPVILPAETAQLVKKRLISFVSSLSTVLAFAYCLSSAIQHAQKFFIESCDLTDTTNMGFHLAGRAVYTAVWIAAATLFMELLGFSTQKWLTAGGLGTVLLTLAGREIFTNFLSSAMLHATRPFVVNEWIQTKIEGYDVSGIVESVGWWAPTIIRGEDREAVYIPNHKFTNIVADMRKVLSKNPQVEQQKLHRRVFLENIDPENQALMILVSCFVKTSHVEEHLSVKEAVLLDLLRVIRHHRARLATPIRSVQKMYPESDLDSVQYAESMFRRGTVSNGTFLLVEPIHKSNEEKSKSQAQSVQANGDDSKAETKSKDSLVNDSDEGASSDLKSTPSTDQKTHEIQSSDVTTGSEVVNLPDVETKDDQTTSPELEVSNGAKPVPKDTKTDGKARQVTPETNLSNSQPEDGVRKSNNTTSHPSPSKQEASLTSKSSMQENIVLGVALEGSKRTLRIDEATDTPNLEDFKELATLCSGNSPILAEKDRMVKEFE